MKIKKKVIPIIVLFLLLISGCTNTDTDIMKTEKEILTNEILELRKLLSQKDEEINKLKKTNSFKATRIKELEEGLTLVKFSSYSRLEDYNNTFENLRNIYKINSNYEIKNDWYVINDDYFQIELLGYQNAEKVEFYTLKLESGEGPILLFSDTDLTNGWIYTSDNIGKIIDKHKEPLNRGGFSYKPYFVIYAEVSLDNGSIIKTPKLPIYNHQIDDIE